MHLSECPALPAHGCDISEVALDGAYARRGTCLDRGTPPPGAARGEPSRNTPGEGEGGWGLSLGSVALSPRHLTGERPIRLGPGPRRRANRRLAQSRPNARAPASQRLGLRAGHAPGLLAPARVARGGAWGRGRVVRAQERARLVQQTNAHKSQRLPCIVARS